MEERWCNLTSRWGEMEFGSPPSDEEIATVIDEVMDEAALLRRIPELSEDDLDEHPGASIALGQDDGPLYLLQLYAGGEMHFTRYADTDMYEEEFHHTRRVSSADQAERLWRLLRDGQVYEVKAAFGDPAEVMDPQTGEPASPRAETDERVRFAGEAQFRDAVRHAFNEHRRAIAELLPGARVEHVGSTAVPGSLTKGDLDLCVLVPPAEFAAADARLAGRYARNLGSIHTAEFAAFTADGGTVDVGIQLVAAGSEWDTFVRWRDRLRADPELRLAYDELKRRFHGEPMNAYRAAKSAFIHQALVHTAD